MRELPLSRFGLMTVGEACARYGWAAKTVQNWVRAGLLPAVVVGAGRGGGSFLLPAADVEAFTPPPRGRPPAKPKKPAPKGRKK